MAEWSALPVQEMQVRSLISEDPTRHRATKPVCHNIELVLLSSEAATTEALTP